MTIRILLCDEYFTADGHSYYILADTAILLFIYFNENESCQRITEQLLIYLRNNEVRFLPHVSKIKIYKI